MHPEFFFGLTPRFCSDGIRIKADEFQDIDLYVLDRVSHLGEVESNVNSALRFCRWWGHCPVRAMINILEMFLEPHLYGVHGLSHILGFALLASDQMDQIVEFASYFGRNNKCSTSGCAFDQATDVQFRTISTIIVIADFGGVYTTFGFGFLGRVRQFRTYQDVP